MRKSIQDFITGVYSLLHGGKRLRSDVDSRVPLASSFVFINAPLSGFGSYLGKPSISSLFIKVGPLAIVLAVVSVIVDALQSESRRTLTHIAEEIEKIFPFFAIGYAASSIVCVMLIGGGIAPLLHVAPDAVSAGPFSVSDHRVSVDGRIFFTDAICEAPATFRSSGSEVSIVDRNHVTAVAFAEPLIVTACCYRPITLSDNEFPESSASFIDAVSIDHDTSISFVSGTENLGGYPTGRGV